MSKLLDYTTEILFATVVIFFFWGIGYLITSDMAQQQEFKQQCIESGMQYVEGSCLK